MHFSYYNHLPRTRVGLSTLLIVLGCDKPLRASARNRHYPGRQQRKKSHTTTRRAGFLLTSRAGCPSLWNFRGVVIEPRDLITPADVGIAAGNNIADLPPHHPEPSNSRASLGNGVPKAFSHETSLHDAQLYHQSIRERGSGN